MFCEAFYFVSFNYIQLLFFTCRTLFVNSSVCLAMDELLKTIGESIRYLVPNDVVEQFRGQLPINIHCYIYCYSNHMHTSFDVVPFIFNLCVCLCISHLCIILCLVTFC